MEDTEVDQTIEMGSSDQLKVGEPAIAIGNPLGHMFSGSVTQGVISGTQRTIPVDINQDGRSDWQAEVIQTDAAINPGYRDRKSTRLNSSHVAISYAVFCLKKKNNTEQRYLMVIM